MAANPQTRVAPTVGSNELHALQTAVAHFDREQLIWSSGFLAGMAGSALASSMAPQSAIDTLQPVTAAASTHDAWHVFFATETGNSRRVAEQLAAGATAAGLVVELHDLGVTRPKLLKTVSNAAFVLATHGIGEPPEGSEPFFEFWLSDKAPRLESLSFSVLAMGDSSYADFCEMGRVFDARLRELGATSVVDKVECDLDFEETANAWTGELVEHASKDVPLSDVPKTARLTAVPSTTSISKQNPFSAGILARQVITGRGSSKNVQHIELDLEDSGLGYLPGDSLGLLAENPARLVDALSDRTGLERTILAQKEITALSRPILDAVAATHPELQSILEDRVRFANFLATRQLIDVVHDYPVDWHEPKYIASLRNLSPRSYSIASSPDANPDEAHLTVAVVDYEAFGRRHLGAASNFLVGNASHAPVYLEPNDNFRLPADGNTPIVMVGAGTGIAPYRAFVEHRREHGHSGDNWLVFGDRNVTSDFLYQLEWLRYRKDGLLTNLDVAFSRDQAEKIYVQDRLLEKGAEVFAWLERGAHFYVCGDAGRMAGDVHAALLAIVKQHGGLSDEGAADYVKNLRLNRRYQRDVY